MTVRLGTRGSALALAQAKMVREAMVGANPGIVIEIVEITTSGDRIQDVPLTPALGQSFFTKELEDALLDGRVDLAVHSSKDLASSMPAGLAMGAFLPREDPRDVLVSASGVGLAGLPEGAKLGTASVRRKSFLRHLRPDLDFLDLRGNVPTRLEKLRSGTYDAIVLAAAGLRRLGLGEHITEHLDCAEVVPSGGQGAVGIQVREDDEATRAAVAAVNHVDTWWEITAERACLHDLGAGCQAPVGVLARLRGGVMEVRGAVASPAEVFRAVESGRPEEAVALGRAVAEGLLTHPGVRSLVQG